MNLVSISLVKSESIPLSPLYHGLCSALDTNLNSKLIGGELEYPQEAQSAYLTVQGQPRMEVAQKFEITIRLI